MSSGQFRWAARTAAGSWSRECGNPVMYAGLKYYQFTAIDDCTRLRVLRIYDQNNQRTAIAFADYVIARLPFQVQTIQTDIQAVFVPGKPRVVRPVV